ncbi:hypothetical protein [Streptosporangium sp. NPDC002524]|uniref:hypothetical protein n=1 Tax=Streptosporangium sp. NPDC002524 TaxID=3154537 RepID=UPI00332E8BB1
MSLDRLFPGDEAGISEDRPADRVELGPVGDKPEGGLAAAPLPAERITGVRPNDIVTLPRFLSWFRPAFVQCVRCSQAMIKAVRGWDMR